MMLIVVSFFSSGLSLKLLESTVPTKPYKAVGPNKQSLCKIMETWNAGHMVGKQPDTAGGAGVQIYPSPNTACAKTLPGATAKWLTAVTGSGNSAYKVKKSKEFATTLDRCCQSPTNSLADPVDNTEVFKGYTNVGFGKPRLPGLSPLCKGWYMTSGTESVTTSTVPTIKFYSTLPNGGGTAWKAAAGNMAAGQSLSYLSITHNKIAPAVPTSGAGVIVLSNGQTKTDFNAVCGAAGASSLACLKEQRKVCMMGSVWESAAGHGLENPYPYVCGGFCRPANSATATFYMTNWCYLDVKTTAATGAQTICYSSKASSPTKAQMPQAFNDPKVVNMAGEQFEILSSGTFSMLDISRFGESNLKILATIDRAGSRCGATYIQNVSLSGTWVKSLGVTDLSIQAASAVPKNTALQVSMDQGRSWQGASQWTDMQNITFTRKLQIKLASVEVEVSVDAHRIVEGERKTRRFANFLNLNVRGVHAVSGAYSVGGLLGSDDHKGVSATPEGCDGGDVGLNLKQLSSVKLHDEPVEEDETDLGVYEDPASEGSCSLENCGAAVPDS